MTGASGTTMPRSFNANAPPGWWGGEHAMGYEAPTIQDYGNLVTLTEATTVVGVEDGASKLTTDNHHSVP
jgi:hypothetical protein